MKLQLSMDKTSQSILLQKVISCAPLIQSSVEKKETHAMSIFERRRLLLSNMENIGQQRNNTRGGGTSI